MHRVVFAFRARVAVGWILPVLALMVGSVPTFGEETLAGQDVASLWTKGCGAIVHGDFTEGASLVRRYLEARPSEPEAKKVAEWLGDQAELERFRNELRQQDYDRHVQKAKNYAKGGKWLDALGKLTLAFVNAADEQKFLNEGWVKDIVAEAEKEAARLREKNDWAEARTFYRELTLLYKKNQTYREALKACHNHVRLEALYGPKSQWQESVRGIQPGMVEDALWRIERGYVEEPNFKDSAEGALKNLLQLAESKSLQETFPELKDAAQSDLFKVRLNAVMAKVNGTPKVDREQVFKHFERILEINAQTLRLPQEVVIAEFMEGVLSSLDSFSSMIWPAEVEEFKKHTVGEFFGVGIQIHKEDDMLRVVSPLEDTPACKAGIRAGDAITKIDGKSTAGITLNQAVQTITGPEGTKVVLTIRREGQKEEIDIPLVRARVKIYTVKGARRNATDNEKWDYMYDPENKIGYLRITSFMENTVEELKEAVGQLEQQGAKGLILDLRFNPGGLLRSAVETADLFLAADLPIVSTKGRASEQWGPVPSHSRDSHPDLPLIVLVNDYSASASEIVSGAFQDHKRALIVGERTFGKGSVQNLINIGDNTAFLKLTTALYYLPSNRSIHKKSEDAEAWGVDPDVSLKVLPQEVRKVIDMRRDADVIHLPGEPPQAAKGNGKAATTQESEAEEAERKPQTRKSTSSDDEAEDKSGDEKKTEAEEAEAAADAAEEEKALSKWPEVDLQLESALLIMRVRLLSNQAWETAQANAQPVGK